MTPKLKKTSGISNDLTGFPKALSYVVPSALKTFVAKISIFSLKGVSSS